MKWLCVIYSPLLKGWMSVCKSVCVCVRARSCLCMPCVRAGVCANVRDFLPVYMCVFMHV